MKFSILKLVQRVPGGMMIIPLILGALCNSFIPQAIEIGGFTTDLLKNGVNAFVAMFFVCSGSQIKLREAATPIIRGTVLCAAKIGIGAVVGLAVAKIWGMNGVLGLSPLALVSAITNSSGTLYVSLAQEFGDKNDVAAIGPLCINDLPFVTMVVFGAAGLAEIPFMSLVASLFPLILGIILGNIDENIRKFLAPGCNVIIPFVAFALGANLRFQSLLSAGISGPLLGINTPLTTGIGGYSAYALTNHGKPRAVGAAIGSCAGICSATPMYVASVDSSLMPYVAEATAACTAATLLTAILCPIFVSLLDKWDKKKDAKRALKESAPT